MKDSFNIFQFIKNKSEFKELFFIIPCRKKIDEIKDKFHDRSMKEYKVRK